jgi:hypothetical protein
MTGIRKINALVKRYPKAEIYFHQDLDGVTTALAMKKYLEDHGVNVVDAHVTQYGSTEFAVKKNDGLGDTMPVLVDFANGKPMFKIHTDHHDRQLGFDAEKTSGQFKKARSNAETLSQIVAKSDLFSDTDILIINTVDSADFVRQGLTTDDVINYLYKYDKSKSMRENKLLQGLVVNKLLLAFKNKQGFLENLVMDSNPSILSVLNNINKWMKENTIELPEDLQLNAEKYIKAMIGHPNVKYEDGIIYQYGMGGLKGTGSYDRYVAFKNQPDANFLIIYWPLGMIQVAKNPFKENLKYEELDLNDRAKKVMEQFQPMLEDKIITLSTIKWVNEEKAKEGSVGFMYNDFYKRYKRKFNINTGGPETEYELKSIMDKLFIELTDDEKMKLDCVTLKAWDLINIGGHPSITNISGLNFIGRGKRPPGPKKPKPKTNVNKLLGDKTEYTGVEYLGIMKTIASKIKDDLENEVVKY